MSNDKTKLTPLSRRLSIYQLFRFCREVSYQEITDQMPSVTENIIQKDVGILKTAGVLQTDFSKKEQAYINIKTDINLPHETKSPTQKKNRERLNRLCFMMKEMYGDPFKWYKENFPELSEKDMHADIRELQKLGLEIINSRYMDALEDMRDYLSGNMTVPYVKVYMEDVIEVLENESMFDCSDVFDYGYILKTYTPREGYFKLD